MEVVAHEIVRFIPFIFTGDVPSKGNRVPMNIITSSEERDEETSFGYCIEYQPHAVKRMFDYKSGMLYDMRWDEAGNLGQVSIAKPGEMFEAGRLPVAADVPARCSGSAIRRLLI